MKIATVLVPVAAGFSPAPPVVQRHSQPCGTLQGLLAGPSRSTGHPSKLPFGWSLRNRDVQSRLSSSSVLPSS